MFFHYDKEVIKSLPPLFKLLKTHEEPYIEKLKKVVSSIITKISNKCIYKKPGIAKKNQKKIKNITESIQEQYLEDSSYHVCENIDYILKLLDSSNRGKKLVNKWNTYRSDYKINIQNRSLLIDTFNHIIGIYFDNGIIIPVFPSAFGTSLK